MSKRKVARHKVFLSYASEDADLAKVLKREIRKEYGDAVGVFMFQQFESIRPTDEPFARIKEELTKDSLILVVATPVSIARPWVNFEAGAGLVTGAGPVVLCAKGLSIEHLYLYGSPLSMKQVINLCDPEQVERVFDQIDDTFPKLKHHRRRFTAVAKAASKETSAWPLRLLKQADEQGVSQLLLRRDVKAPEHGLTWAQLLASCTASVRLVGWSCMNVLGGVGERGRFATLLDKANTRLEFLILDKCAVAKVEKSASLNLGCVCHRRTPSILSDLRRGREEIKSFIRDQASDEKRKRIEVHHTDWFMPWSAVALDVFGKCDEILPDGLLQVEMFTCWQDGKAHPEKPDPDERPLLVLRNSPSGYYQALARSIAAMWKAAKPLPWEEL